MSAPWYVARRDRALWVAAGLYAVICVFEGLDTNSSDAIALWYMLPIALIAVSWGFRGGLVAAAVGTACFCAFAELHSTGYMGTDDWVTRIGAMVLLGGLLGRASEQSMRAHINALHNQRKRLELEEEVRRYAEGIELGDSVLQHMAAAQWMLDAGSIDQAAELISTAMEQGQRIVSELLPGQTVGNAGNLQHRG